MIVSPAASDGPKIHALAAAIPIFAQEEVECVDELWNEYQERGPEASGYTFLIDREGETVRGFACFGPRALTDRTFDLYWIAVDAAIHRGGVGRGLLAATEEAVRTQGGRLLIVETSGLEKYAPTRAFYLATGYIQEAILKDFYRDGDDLVIFTKHL